MGRYTAGAVASFAYERPVAAVDAFGPDVDPARVGIWGGSYGGYLTALALGRNSDVFAAGVDIHGVHSRVIPPPEAIDDGR